MGKQEEKIKSKRKRMEEKNGDAGIERDEEE
jgi:hypothetical protein